MIGCMTFYVAASQKCQLLDILCISGDMKCGTHLSLQARWSKDQWLSWIAVIFSQGLQRVYFFLANFKDRQNTGTEKFPLFDRNVGISLFVERPRCPCPRPSQLCDKAQMCHAECGTPGLWWSHGLEQSDQCHWVHQLWHLQYRRNCAKGTGHGHCHEQGVTVVCVSWSFPFHSTIGESWFYIIL